MSLSNGTAEPTLADQILDLRLRIQQLKRYQANNDVYCRSLQRDVESVLKTGETMPMDMVSRLAASEFFARELRRLIEDPMKKLWALDVTIWKELKEWTPE